VRTNRATAKVAWPEQQRKNPSSFNKHSREYPNFTLLLKPVSLRPPIHVFTRICLEKPDLNMVHLP
jgi:hypothetical protein